MGEGKLQIQSIKNVFNPEEQNGRHEAGQAAQTAQHWFHPHGPVSTICLHCVMWRYVTM